MKVESVFKTIDDYYVFGPVYDAFEDEYNRIMIDVEKEHSVVKITRKTVAHEIYRVGELTFICPFSHIDDLGFLD